MRVNDQNLTGPSVNDAGKAQETQRSTGTGHTRTAGAGGTEDRVELSSTVGTLSRAVSGDQSSRAYRIEALAAQFAVGTYQPDSAATSRGIVSEALAEGDK